MKNFNIYNSLEEIVRTVSVNTIEEVEDIIYDLKSYHGFNMTFTYE